MEGSASVSTSFSHKVTVTNSEEQSFQTEEVIGENTPVELPANSVNTFEETWIKREVPVKFTGQVILDGPVKANLENIRLISQVLPNAADRSAAFEGFVYNSVLYGAAIKNYSRTATAAECSDPQNAGKVTYTSEAIGR
jgi:hypothetical protein